MGHFRKSLSSSQREALYDRCRGAAEFPTCNIPWCGRPVRPGERWVESHYPVPHANGGDETGIAHECCNRLYAARVEVPAMAHADRVRRRHIGAHVARHKLPCGRDSRFKKTMDGRVVARAPRLLRFVPLTDDDPIASLTDQLIIGDLDEMSFAHRAGSLGASIDEIGELILLARVSGEMRA